MTAITPTSHTCPTPFRDMLTELTAKTDLQLNVFILPGTLSDDGVSGQAFRDTPDGRCYINIHGAKPVDKVLFVLLHELAHHLYGDTSHWSSQPIWITEYRADRYALRHLKDIVHPDSYWALDQMSRQHIQPLLQRMIDADISHHVDLKIADWAGCDVPDDMRAELIARDASYGNTSNDEGIPF